MVKQYYKLNWRKPENEKHKNGLPLLLCLKTVFADNGAGRFFNTVYMNEQEQIKSTTDTFFTWLTRISLVLLTIMGTQIMSSFNEVKSDVKLLLKEHEEVKTKVDVLWQREIVKNKQ
jgi:hypothetical protein